MTRSLCPILAYVRHAQVIPYLKDRPDLDRLLKAAIAKFDAMSPEQQREHRRAQAKSWVIGEMMLEHPEMTRDQAAEIYDRVAW